MCDEVFPRGLGRKCWLVLSVVDRFGFKSVSQLRITNPTTRCIESGIDIPTVSRWLGHQDGGVLAMKT
jgi:hypothetical protein